MYEISLLAPIAATLVALLNFILVYYNYRGKPWEFKSWLIIGMVGWIPWAGFTILMRITPSANMALWYLRFSFISSYFSFYALYRFHHILLYKPTDNRFEAFGLAALMGLNIGLGVNETFLSVVRTDDGLYWTDLFSPELFVLHVLYAFVIGIWIYRSLYQLDLFSFFYGGTGGRSIIQLVVAGIIVASVGVLMLIFFIQGGSTDSTSFLIFSLFITSFLGITYGVNPVSKVLAPQRVWAFFMTDRSGLPVFEHTYSDEDSVVELALVSAALNASSETIKEYLGSDTPLQMVELEDRVILIEHKDNLMFSMIADYSSQQLEIVLQDLVARISGHDKFEMYEPGKSENNYEFVRKIVENSLSG